MSNLIKSERVIDLETPINVSVSYAVTEKNRIISEKPKRTVKSSDVLANDVGNLVEESLSKEEIVEQYIKEAEAKAKLVYDEQMNRAFNEGVKKAEIEANSIIEQAKIEYERILEEVNELKEITINEYKNEIKSNENEIVDLALSIAEKIINCEVNKSEDYIVKIVEDAVNRVVNKKDVTVKLSTQDYYIINQNKKLLITRVKGFGEIELIQDESLEPGNCIVDTPLGIIDGSLQVRMDNIQREIKKLLDR